MKKLLMILVVGSMMVLGFSMAASAISDADTYYPMKDGNMWEYQLLENGEPFAVQTMGVISVKGNKVIIGAQQNREVVSQLYFEVAEDGIYRCGQDTIVGSSQTLPKQLVVKHKLKAGDKWTWKSADKKNMRTAVVGPTEKVTVPGGTFDAITVTYFVQGEDFEYEEKTWYVKGLGYVKSVQKAGPLVLTTELVNARILK